MQNQYNISESEWKILEVLWQQESCMMADIATALKESGWQYSTIRTLTTRLVEKGYLNAAKEGKYYRYSAAVAEGECRVAEAESMLSRVFGGSVSALVSALAGSKSVSPREKAELEALIAQMDANSEAQDAR